VLSAPSTRTRLLLVLALVGALMLVLSGPGASAAPGDDEGGTASLRKKLADASKGYTTAKARLQNSQQKQRALRTQATATQQRLVLLRAEAQRLGVAAYRGGEPDPALSLADAGSIPDLLDRMTYLDNLSSRNKRTFDTLRATEATLRSQKAKIDREVKTQRTQLQTMTRRKADAQAALSEVGGGQSAGFLGGDSPAAQPAARASDGTWPSESCSVADPTTQRCVTPRMLHAYQQARAAGFTHYTACNRDASFGEHGKGRACDFAASASGFGPAASGADKLYGDRLAAWFVDNADRLAVLYVIWYRQIWLPGQGWSNYHSGSAPASAHTNHVHLSVQ
jgi:hypothetical protein